MQYDDVTTNQRWRTAAVLSLYLSQESSDFNESWWVDAAWFEEQSRDKISKFCKFKMEDGRHIENSFLAIFQPFIVRLTQILV